MAYNDDSDRSDLSWTDQQFDWNHDGKLDSYERYERDSYFSDDSRCSDHEDHSTYSSKRTSYSGRGTQYSSRGSEAYQQYLKQQAKFKAMTPEERQIEMDRLALESRRKAEEKLEDDIAGCVVLLVIIFLILFSLYLMAVNTIVGILFFVALIWGINHMNIKI